MKINHEYVNQIFVTGDYWHSDRHSWQSLFDHNFSDRLDVDGLCNATVNCFGAAICRMAISAW